MRCRAMAKNTLSFHGPRHGVHPCPRGASAGSEFCYAHDPRPRTPIDHEKRMVTQVRHALYRAGITSQEALDGMTDEQLLDLRAFGPRSVAIARALDLQPRSEPPEWVGLSEV